MTGIELVVGYVAAGTVRKARRVGSRVDGVVDEVLDAGLHRLDEAVAGKLGADTALAKLTVEAASGEVTVRTVERVRLSLEDAAAEDPDFARQLGELVERLDAAGGRQLLAVARQVVTVGRDVHIEASDRAVAGWTFSGPVSAGNPPPPGPVMQ